MVKVGRKMRQLGEKGMGEEDALIFLKVLCMEKRHIQPGAHTNLLDFASLLRGKSRRAELGKTHLEQGEF